MPSSYDSILPIGFETPLDGGTQTRTSPTEFDPTQDAAAIAAVHLVGTGVSKLDKTVYVDRVANALRMSDATTQRTLAELVTSVSGQTNAHDNQRDFAHYLGGNGPTSGTGYLARTFNGPLLISETWYTSSAMTTKIVQRALAYPSGSPLPSSCVWTVFGANGAALKVCTDTYIYAGPTLTNISRGFANAN